MSDIASKEQNETNPEKKHSSPICNCGKDPFDELPPELRPANRTWKSGLRNVTCPSCGLEYWTNREGDLCTKCRKKGIRNPETEKIK